MHPEDKQSTEFVSKICSYIFKEEFIKCMAQSIKEHKESKTLSGYKGKMARS